MGRYLLLWLLGVPIPILVLIYAFGGLHWYRSPDERSDIRGRCCHQSRMSLCSSGLRNDQLRNHTKKAARSRPPFPCHF